MTIQELIEKAQSRHACQPAMDWLRKQKRNRKGAQWAWDNCSKPHWLEWYLEAFGGLGQVGKWRRTEYTAYRKFCKVRDAALAKHNRAVTEGRDSRHAHDTIYSPPVNSARVEYTQARFRAVRTIMPSP